jgi:hypothetical protein
MNRLPSIVTVASPRASTPSRSGLDPQRRVSREVDAVDRGFATESQAIVADRAADDDGVDIVFEHHGRPGHRDAAEGRVSR